MKSVKISKGESARRFFSESEDLSIELAQEAVADLLIVANGACENQQIEISQKENSVLRLTILDASKGDLKRYVHITLDGMNASCRLNGVFVTSDLQRVSSYIRIDHLAQGCESFQNFRGVASGSSRGFFQGYIYVDPQAQDTVALQENHNILLSDKAEIKTEPQLEIYADRVKCNHGATVGREDAQALFYCRQRGIAPAAARALLVEGFCRAALVLDGFSDEIEQQVFGMLTQKLTEL